MRIGIVTDEISTDVHEAIGLGVGWGIKDYELRVVGETRVPAITPATVDALLQLKNKFGIRYTALSPGTGKGSIDDQQTLARELDETLPATFALAKKLETHLVIIFGFQRLPHQPDALETEVVEAFRRIAFLAEQHGLMLAIENEPGFWCDTGRNTARILAAVNSPFLRANWDPANALGTDEVPYPDGYEALKKWIFNVHVKDTIKGALLECVPIGEGRIDWEKQIQALVRDDLVKHVTIETHCHPLIENSQKNLQRLRQILQQLGKKKQ
ncbi:MAG: sugar phosphate isomerase/epimerase [candidate division KSB1 bacterium]|nr:sugar phosphate isomerase/epimerase [candidate division KSB1 bacterium]MDZ7305110.1 sugar phosphate isomerase/epimerase [candidate division KSB1 bacterium]MDZ7314189.1 sugar phosphate isomerase/epimerase [candidate division KSB1 bacterium]